MDVDPGTSSLATGMNRRRFLKLTALTGSTLAAGHLTGLFSARNAHAAPASNAVRFAVIGDYGETLRDQQFPVDQLGGMIRSWNPDFVVSVGDNNYILGEASTIDTNIGKNFSPFIYPKGTGYPEYYPYPDGAPPYNRFFAALGNHDYADYADHFDPTPAHIANSNPYLGYFTASLTGPQAPNTVVTFANNSPGQTYSVDDQGDYVCGSYAPFSEATNIRFYDVRLGTATGPSSVHLFIFDSNVPTPYGRYWKDETITNADNTCSATVLATQGAWLQQRLAASTARWKIVIFHHPPYYSGTGGKDLQYEMMRWPFQAWGATAVITGHVHNYERLFMPDADANNQPDYSLPTIPYFVNGAGGFVPEQGFDPNFVVPGSQVRVENYGAQLISADEDSLSFLFFDINGVLRDSYTIWNNPADAPKDVQFSSPEFVVASNAGTAQLTVTRQGDASQPLTVQYTTMDGTAKQAVNYLASAGALSFAAGETTKSLPITLVQTVYPPDADIPPTLAFNVLLSTPSGGTSLGFFASATVVIQNEVDTPLNDLDAFIEQTYLDVLARSVTPTEHTAARVWIGFGSSDPTVQELAFLSHFRRAEWITNLLTTSFTGDPNTTAPNLNVSLIHSLLYLNPIAGLENPASVPTYPDYNFWTSQWIAQSGTKSTSQLITQTAEGFSENILEVLYSYFRTSPNVPALGGDPALDATAFILGVYYVFILPLGSNPTVADIVYWLPIVKASKGRYTMLGRISAENFNPPPVSGMTAFNLAGTTSDLAAGNQLLAILAAANAGLTRTEPTFNEFYYQLWWNIRYSSNVPGVLTDTFYNILISPEYARRFTLPSAPTPTPTPSPTPSPTPQKITVERVVRQRGRFVYFRGTATPGIKRIELRVLGRDARTVLESRPNWSARLPTLPSRGNILVIGRVATGVIAWQRTYRVGDFLVRPLR